jgi:pilus assembly protein CpaE
MAGNKILIVDPDPASRNFLAVELKKHEYEVLQTGSGKEALIFAWRDRPDIIVVDPVVSDLKGEELAAKLRQDPRTARLALIALSSDPRPERIRSCTEAGFNEYLLKSGQALPALIEAINRLLNVESISAKEGGLLIVFLSAKGGTGTSSLAVNLAMQIAQSQPEGRVVLADLVLPMGSLAGLAGAERARDIVTVADLPPAEITPRYFREGLTQLPAWRFWLLAGATDPDSANRLKVARINDIVSSLRSAYDYVLVDVGRSLSRFNLPLIQHADLITLVLSTDLSAMDLTKTLWDYLQSKGVEPASLYTILNRAVGLEGLTKPEVEKILGLKVNAAVPYLAGNFSLANNQHQPFSLKFPKDTASVIFRESAQQMVAQAKRLRAGHA